MTATTIQALINPLAFLEVDHPWSTANPVEVTAEHVLKFLANPGDPRSLPDLVDRYRKVSIEDPRLFAAPAEARLLERLIWPLRQAKGNFMLGHYLATISLAGMVSEMAAILIFDLGNVQLNQAPLDDTKQRALFGSSFEKLGQERRVEVLAAYDLIDAGLKQSFDLIRTSRRKYLHLWSADHATLESDAITCFKAAVLIVVSTLRLNIDNGKLVLRDEVLKYLAKNKAGPNLVAEAAGG